MEQIVEQCDLIGIKMAPQGVGHDVEVRARPQDVCGRVQVAGRGRGVGQRAGLVVKSQGQDGGLERRERNLPRLQLLDQDRRRRADLFDLAKVHPRQLGFSGGLIRVRMVIVDVNLHLRPAEETFQHADALGLLRVHENQPRDLLEIEVFQSGHPEIVDRQEAADRLLGAAREHEQGARIELAGRHH